MKSGLVKKQIVDKRGRRTSVWVQPNIFKRTTSKKMDYKKFNDKIRSIRWKYYKNDWESDVREMNFITDQFDGKKDKSITRRLTKQFKELDGTEENIIDIEMELDEHLSHLHYKVINRYEREREESIDDEDGWELFSYD